MSASVASATASAAASAATAVSSAASAPMPTLSLSLGNTLGVAYIGSVISAVLYGVTCVQTFYYFRSTRNDGRWVPALVLSLLLLDTLHQCFITHIFYWYCITNYANPLSLIKSVWSISSEVIVNAVIAFLVESFLCYRLWRLSQNYLVAGVCYFFTIAHFTMNLVYPIRGFFFTNLLDTGNERQTGISGLAVATVTDVLISSCLAFYLSRSRTGFKKSDTMIDKLIAMTVTTGVLTTVFVIANMIAYVAGPEDLYVMFFNFMLGKLYINALLTSLNVREAILNESMKASETSGINSIPLGSIGVQSQGGGKPLSVNVQHVIERETGRSLEDKRYQRFDSDV